MLTLTVFGAWLPPSVVRSDTYEVDVRPYENERRAIPIDGSNPYDAELHIVPERDCGWVLADSKIIAQNLLSWRSDMTLWKPGGKTPGLHVYHLCNAVSSLEYVFITGTLTKRGNGGGGHTDLPWFDVMVPSVDIDWTGFGYETQGSATFEKYTADKFEDGEDTRIVPISTSVDQSLCSRFVINPPKDDNPLLDKDRLVTPCWS